MHHHMGRNGNARNSCVSCNRTFHRPELNHLNRVSYFMITWGVWWSVKCRNCTLRASMVVTYYIKLFRTGAGRYNGILMSLLLLVAETKIWCVQKTRKTWLHFWHFWLDIETGDYILICLIGFGLDKQLNF